MIKVFYRSFVVLVLLVIIGNYSAPSAAAHVLDTDGSIGAIIHLDPEDDPIVGVPTNIYFEIKDKQNRFSPETCKCKAEIYKAGTLIHTQELYEHGTMAPSFDHASLTYTFPEPNIYEVVFSGQPEFKLSYTIRVSRTIAPPADTNANSLPILIAVLIFTICIFLFIFKHKKHTAKLVSLIFLLGLFLHVFIVAHPHANPDNLIHACCLTSHVTVISKVIFPQPQVFSVAHLTFSSPTSLHVFLLDQPARSPPLV